MEIWEKHAESLALHIPSEINASQAPTPTSQKRHSKLNIFAGRHRSHSDATSVKSVESTNSPVSPYLEQSTSEAAKNMAVTFSRSTDEKLQAAIDLHEAGKLEESTRLFEQLADPHGINHPLAQVLLGLCFRHGWGVAVNTEQAFRYLRLAAENSAMVDQIAASGGATGLKPSGRNKSRNGFAKGELVLAIYELGNCFRNGWGTDKDPKLALQYYETAARLGDVDAMSEAASCYMSGFGTKKNKHQAAKFFRMAEKAGRVEVGNSWIWKDKYNDIDEKKK